MFDFLAGWYNSDTSPQSSISFTLLETDWVQKFEIIIPAIQKGVNVFHL